MQHRYLFLLATLLLLNTPVSGQTTLSPGDLVIVQVEAEGTDTFRFIPLVDLEAGTVIYFTDCGVSAAGAFNAPCTEGDIAYTAPAGGTTAGTIVTYPGADFSSHSDTRITGSFSLSVAGDQVFAFQDSD